MKISRLALAIATVCFFPTASYAQVQTLLPGYASGAAIPGRNTLINGQIEAKQFADWSATFQNTSVNPLSARRINDGFIIRVKRMIMPGSDVPKRVANVLTLGLFSLNDGAALRATWLTMNCKNKDFNVTGDGYAWQNIWKDQYGQAEDLYYAYCVPQKTGSNPLYLLMAEADPDMITATEIGQ
ncbi:hypothetical protein KBY79_11400 [Synechococcus lacustris C3-12m-Tous]|uniref:hypothetical protein n=1 Tax=Synechococcus lacustris TaxID=2116544 RepID=UPI0020CE3EA4|nr:hypothetical protein [Synechococcus lacustris]MCP9925812.1 hypothetical protein [Synechococcus lacustris C3-12m-Tous]